MMDKKAKKKLREEYQRVRNKIGRLLKRFTPIDPNDDDSHLYYGGEYNSSLDALVAVLMRDKNRESLFKILEDTRQHHNAPLDPEKDWSIVDAILDSMDDATPRLPSQATYELDLRTDVDPITDYFVRQIDAFDINANIGPGDGKQVTEITVGYQYDQAGWVAMVFDTRATPSQDGEWTTCFARGELLNRESWLWAIAANHRDPIVVIDHLGGKHRIEFEQAESELANYIGELIKEIIIKLISKNLFATLPITKQCRIFINEWEEEYIWPEPGKDDRINFAIPK